MVDGRWLLGTMFHVVVLDWLQRLVCQAAVEKRHLNNWPFCSLNAM